MSVVVASAIAAPAVKQPNILFLSMDDLKPELGCYGSKVVKTPNIDRLAKGGMLFEHHYVQQAVCGPSRASMFSGLRPDTTRVWDLRHTCREECPQAFTMQEYFKNNGYQTTGSGKIMHGFKNDDPPSWSIPYVWPGDLPYADGKVPALYQQYQAEAIHEAAGKLEKSGLKKYKEKQQFMAGLNAKPSTECLDQPDDAYCDGAMTVWAMDMLDQFAKDGKPFFLTLGYRKPHLPFVAPKKYWDLYDREEIEMAVFQKMPKGAPGYAYHPGYELGGYSDIEIKELGQDAEKQRELIHGYYACVSYVDAQIGKVMDKLKETGLDKNTIIVLWGDHGWHLGDHNIWCKHSTYEQATRSPLIISMGRGAGDMERGARSYSPVESIDIFPTLCELAGLPVPDQLEGTSMVPVFKDPAAKVKEFAMSQYPDHGKNGLMGYALRNERYRLVVWVDEEVSRSGSYDPSKIDAVELYDYVKDPLETVNLAKNPEYKSVVKDLEDKVEGFFSR
jgi:arylsulfatase A-like enzyme